MAAPSTGWQQIKLSACENLERMFKVHLAGSIGLLTRVA